MLKRHPQTSYGLSPDAYRTKWGLPRDFPMVAPNYAATRSGLAKKIGLGRKQAAAMTELDVSNFLRDARAVPRGDLGAGTLREGPPRRAGQGRSDLAWIAAAGRPTGGFHSRRLRADHA